MVADHAEVDLTTVVEGRHAVADGWEGHCVHKEVAEHSGIAVGVVVDRTAVVDCSPEERNLGDNSEQITAQVGVCAASVAVEDVEDRDCDAEGHAARSAAIVDLSNHLQDLLEGRLVDLELVGQCMEQSFVGHWVHYSQLEDLDPAVGLGVVVGYSRHFDVGKVTRENHHDHLERHLCLREEHHRLVASAGIEEAAHIRTEDSAAAGSEEDRVAAEEAVGSCTAGCRPLCELCPAAAGVFAR